MKVPLLTVAASVQKAKVPLTLRPVARTATAPSEMIARVRPERRRREVWLGLGLMGFSWW